MTAVGMGTWSMQDFFSIVQTGAILFGVPVIAFRLGRSTEALKASVKSQGDTMTVLVEEFKELKQEQKDFRDTLTQVALQNQRLDNQGQQISMLQRLVEDLRRGEGLILPLALARPTSGG